MRNEVKIRIVSFMVCVHVEIYKCFCGRLSNYIQTNRTTECVHRFYNNIMIKNELKIELTTNEFI